MGECDSERRLVSRADGIRGEFHLVTMASIPWMLPECWHHQSDCSIHIITTFNPMCTNPRSDLTGRLQEYGAHFLECSATALIPARPSFISLQLYLDIDLVCPVLSAYVIPCLRPSNQVTIDLLSTATKRVTYRPVPRRPRKRLRDL